MVEIGYILGTKKGNFITPGISQKYILTYQITYYIDIL